jgi:hypothetical protein
LEIIKLKENIFALVFLDFTKETEAIMFDFDNNN